MKLSIIIPFYNTEKYISRCIDSILSQTFSDWELILIDDGSTDNCLKLCEEYASRDHRIKILTQRNSGQGAARNYGLKIAKGEFVTFIDSDDVLLDSETFSYAINAFSCGDDIDIVQFPFIKFNDKQTIVQPEKVNTILTSKEDLILHSDVLNMLYPTGSVVKTSPWPKIYRKELFYTVKFPEGIVYEDTYLFCELLSKIRKIVLIEKGLYGNYERINSTTTAPIDSRKAHDRIVVLIKILETLRKYSADKKKISGVYHWILKLIGSFQARLKYEVKFKNLIEQLCSNRFQDVCPHFVSVIGVRKYIYILTLYYRLRL